MSVHRVRIQADRGGDPVAVDLALPSGTPVGELLPAVVHLVDDRAASGAPVHGWRLDRLTGGTLSESLSLTANDVHDGELLALLPEHAPPLGVMRLDPCREIAAAQPSHPVVDAFLPGAVCVLAAILAAVALAWTGAITPSPTTLVIAAVGTCAAAAATLTTRHPTAPGMATIALAAATGFLAVPSDPSAANAFLAATAAFAAALLVQRLSGPPNAAVLGAATVSVLIAAVTVLTMPATAVGTLLATGSLGLMAFAPRAAVLIARLGPEHWTDDMDARAYAGHATLTGLLAGCATGAAMGAVLVAAAGSRSIGAVAFPMLVGLALLLQSRTHADPPRRISLVANVLVITTSAVGIVALTHPAHVGWMGSALVAGALLADRRPRMGAWVSRMTDRLEYAVLAAVVPVALWVGGAYSLVGEVRL